MLFSFSYPLAVLISLSLPDPSSAGSGAAYVITNDPSGNLILAMNIASNGTLNGVTATSTGGIGGAFCSGVPPNCTSTGPTPLNSQGSIETNAAKNLLVTVNPGSNSLSMFQIDHDNPALLTMVGSPVFSGGDFPVSLAINNQGTMVCVLNAGTINGVNCYTPDFELGLIAIPNTLRSLGLIPPPPPAGSPSQVVFSEDGQTLIAAVKGLPPATPGFLAAWAIASDGSLSAEFISSTAPQGSLAPYSTTLIPGTNAILVSDATVGFDIFDYGAENSLSATSSAFLIPGQVAVCWSGFSSKSGNFYLTDTGTSIVTEVNVDQNLQGTVVGQYQQAANSATIDIDIASVGLNDFLYILAAETLTVDVLNVNVAGNAVMVQTFDLASAAKNAGVMALNPNYVEGMTTFVS